MVAIGVKEDVVKLSTATELQGLDRETQILTVSKIWHETRPHEAILEVQFWHWKPQKNTPTQEVSWYRPHQNQSHTALDHIASTRGDYNTKMLANAEKS